MNLEECDRLMKARDLGFYAHPDDARRTLLSLADEVPGLVAEVRRVTREFDKIATAAVHRENKLRETLLQIREVEAIHRRWQNTELSDAGAMCEIATVLYKTEKPVEAPCKKCWEDVNNRWVHQGPCDCECHAIKRIVSPQKNCHCCADCEHINAEHLCRCHE